MTIRDEEAIANAFGRLEPIAGRPLEALLRPMLSEVAHPVQAMANLERWATSSSNPRTQLDILADLPKLARLVMILLGSSQRLSDAVIQNPELVSLITDAGALQEMPTVEKLISEGDRLLAVSNGYTHALDRLRFLRQSWMVRIAINDLAGLAPQPEIWRALSILAEALVRLAHRAAWKEYAGLKDLHGSCPVSVVAFGKLGGWELNYSSDIDLVYVLDDGLDESMERHGTRFAEMLNRALAEAMGRGSLYRVDLRLRPYGKSGPLTPTWRSVETYYRSYAEEWEQQALLRSRAIVGDDAFVDAWNRLRETQCFRPALAESAVDEMVAMRQRTEDYANEQDLKRGPGGIRDIEFLVQILQRAHGYGDRRLQSVATMPTLDALEMKGLLSSEVVAELKDGYIFLRKLEHRLQIDDRQTHEMPSDAEAIVRLACLMGEPDAESLLAKLERVRSRVREHYQAHLDFKPASNARATVLASLEAMGPDLATWFDSLPESEAFYTSLSENQDSLNRIRAIGARAPILVDAFRASVDLTEALMSGEIEEAVEQPVTLSALRPNLPLESVAVAFRSAWTRRLANLALGNLPLESVGNALQELFDGLVQHLLIRVGAGFDLIALGSYASGDLSIGSDLDVLLLVGDAEAQPAAEQQAQALLALIDRLRALGVPIEIDLRLRPEGGKGLLVRSDDGFRLYSIAGMEMWERFALGQARRVAGRPEAAELVAQAAYDYPLTPARFDELLAMKRRIETERVPAKYGRRNVKLGIGGLSDIDWFIRLHEMRYPTATHAAQNVTFADRLRGLAEARLIHFGELEELAEARAHLTRVRTQLALFGFTPDVIPENPDRLDRLGASFGYADGNAFLAAHEQLIDRVRQIYNEGIERLRA